jgi:hypothetical protein
MTKDYKLVTEVKSVCRGSLSIYFFSLRAYANMVVIYKITALLFACMIYEEMF